MSLPLIYFISLDTLIRYDKKRKKKLLKLERYTKQFKESLFASPMKKLLTTLLASKMLCHLNLSLICLISLGTLIKYDKKQKKKLLTLEKYTKQFKK